MKKLIFITFLVFSTLVLNAQFIKTFLKVRTDSIAGYNDTIFVTNEEGSEGYIYTKDDSLYFGDASGQKALGKLVYRSEPLFTDGTDTLRIYFNADTVNFESNLDFLRFSSAPIVDSIKIYGIWYTDPVSIWLSSGGVTSMVYPDDTLKIGNEIIIIESDTSKFTNTLKAERKIITDTIQVDDSVITEIYQGVIPDTTEVSKMINDKAGGGGVAGNNTEIQFNDNGFFGSSSNLTWNDNNLTIIGNVNLDTIDYGQLALYNSGSQFIVHDQAQDELITLNLTSSGSYIYDIHNGSSIFFYDDGMRLNTQSERIYFNINSHTPLSITDTTIIAYDSTHLDYLTPDNAKFLTLSPTKGIYLKDAVDQSSILTSDGITKKSGDTLVLGGQLYDDVQIDGNLKYFEIQGDRGTVLGLDNNADLAFLTANSVAGDEVKLRLSSSIYPSATLVVDQGPTAYDHGFKAYVHYTEGHVVSITCHDETFYSRIYMTPKYWIYDYSGIEVIRTDSSGFRYTSDLSSGFLDEHLINKGFANDTYVTIDDNIHLPNANTDTSDYKLMLDENDTIIKSINVYAGTYLDSVTASVTITTQDVWYKIGNMTQAHVFENASYTQDTIWIDYAGIYEVITAGIAANGTGVDDDYEIGLSVNGAIPCIESRTKSNIKTDWGNLSGRPFHCRFDVGDYLVLKVVDRTGTDNISFLYGGITIKKLN